jgi:hypothetical protein
MIFDLTSLIFHCLSLFADFGLGLHLGARRQSGNSVLPPAGDETRRKALQIDLNENQIPPSPAAQPGVQLADLPASLEKCVWIVIRYDAFTSPVPFAATIGASPLSKLRAFSRNLSARGGPLLAPSFTN